MAGRKDISKIIVSGRCVCSKQSRSEPRSKPSPFIPSVSTLRVSGREDSRNDFLRSTLDFVVECDTVVALVVGRGGRPEGEWIASRVREAALWFDNLIGHHLATDETQIKHRPSGAWNQDGKWSAGILEYWGRRPQESARAVGEIMREKLRIFTHFSAKFHESSHRSGPWLRDFTHFYG